MGAAGREGRRRDRGLVFVDESSFGFGEIGMLVARSWRGRGVGTALVAAADRVGTRRGLHKLTLGVFPHNEAAVALYRKFGFVEEGRRIEHIRRANGEFWDLIDMGLLPSRPVLVTGASRGIGGRSPASSPPRATGWR